MPSQIDDMKSLLSKRDGIARGNRYGVHFTHPTITNGKQGSNSWVQDGRDTWILCTAAVLPGKRISTTEATHNHHLAKKPYSMATDEVTMTFLLTGDYYMKKYFDLWQEMIVDSTGNHYKTYFKTDYCAPVQIDALHGDEEDTVGYSIVLQNAYPIQVSQVELGEGVEGMIEVTVTWEYDNWKPTEDQKKATSTKSSWLPPLHGPAGGPERQVQRSSFGPAGRGFI
tara:strand:- start:750 stop:1427 length:678 start_codon:yes stop_codon:yes gene_type:complete